MSKCKSRKQIIRDLQLDCGHCQSKITPAESNYLPDLDLHIYMGTCPNCGSLVQGAIGPEDALMFFEAFMSGVVSSRGEPLPTVRVDPLPAGW